MKDVISKHIFTFPFKWDCKNTTIDNLNYFEEVLKCSDYKWLRVEHFLEKEIDRIDVRYTNIKTGHKENKEMTVSEKVQLQNTLEYYYPEVKNIMLDFNYEKNFLRCYELDFVSGIYVIQVKKNYKYELDLEKIVLKVYPTGVALLSYFLKNKIYKDEREILEINQVGRRIKYPYIGQENSRMKYNASSGTTAIKLSIEFTQNKENSNNELLKIDGRFKIPYRANIETNKVYILSINSIVTELLGDGFSRKDSHRKIKYDLVIDDRMHVVSYYFNDKMPSNENKNFFYEYTFIDSKDSSKNLNDSFMKELINKNSYERWSSHNYGISNYSFVCHGLKERFNQNVISTHVEGIYYQMIAIHLMQKASLQKFSSDLSEINSLKEFRKIQKSYLDFIANYCHEDLTAQEQGIELYDMVKKITGISEKIDQVNSKINQLVDFYTQDSNEKLNKNMNLLTILVGLFSLWSWVLSMFSYYQTIKDEKITFLWDYSLLLKVIFNKTYYNINISYYFIICLVISWIVIKIFKRKT